MALKSVLKEGKDYVEAYEFGLKFIEEAGIDATFNPYASNLGKIPAVCFTFPKNRGFFWQNEVIVYNNSPTNEFAVDYGRNIDDKDLVENIEKVALDKGYIFESQIVPGDARSKNATTFCIDIRHGFKPDQYHDFAEFIRRVDQIISLTKTPSSRVA